MEMNPLSMIALICIALLITRLLFPGLSYADLDNAEKLIRPGHNEWPMAWTSYRTVNSLEEDIEDLKAHGVGLISRRARSVEDARESLEVAKSCRRRVEAGSSSFSGSATLLSRLPSYEKT